MIQFLLILLFTLARTFGFGVLNSQNPIKPNDDIDVSDYVLPEEFFPENDRDAIPAFRQVPDIDVSQFRLPDGFYPENDRDAIPIRRFLHRRPPSKFQPRTGGLIHSSKVGRRFGGLKNEGPIYEWNMKMKKRNVRTMNPFSNPFDYCCPIQQLYR